jgi:hypothetical protein
LNFFSFCLRATRGLHRSPRYEIVEKVQPADALLLEQKEGMALRSQTFSCRFDGFFSHPTREQRARCGVAASADPTTEPGIARKTVVAGELGRTFAWWRPALAFVRDGERSSVP